MSVSPPSLSLPELLGKLLSVDRSLQEAGEEVGERSLLIRVLAAADAAPGLLAYIDSSERYRFCNRAFEEWYGEPRERILGKTLREVVGDTAYVSVRAEVQRALSGKRVQFERVVPYRAAGTRTIRADYYPHVLPDGRVAGAVGVVADITQLHRTEEADRLAVELRECEDRLRLATAATELGMWDFEPLTGRRRWDEKCLELWGLPSGTSVSYETFLQGIHPDERARVHATVLQSLDPKGAGAYDIEYRLAGVNTRESRWIAAHGQVFFDAQQRPVRFLGTMRDITARKQTRERMSRLYAVAAGLSDTLQPEEVAGVVVREAAAALEAAMGALVAVSEDGTALELRAEHGLPEDAREAWRRFPIEAAGMFREVHRTGQPVLHKDLASFRRAFPQRGAGPALQGSAFAAVPLKLGGRVVGVLGFSFASEQELQPEDVQFLEALGRQCAVALERARLQASERQAREEVERLKAQLAAR